MAYCVRCGSKCSLFNSVSMINSSICGDCMKEFNVDSSERSKFSAGTYEMLLCSVKFRNPELLESIPGARKAKDSIPPEPMPEIRTAKQILAEDFKVEKPEISLSHGETCYFAKGVTLSMKTVQKIKSGGDYSGFSINLGGGIRYGIGGRSATKVKTKEVTNTESIKLFITSEGITMKIKESYITKPYSFIDSIQWNGGNLDFYFSDENQAASISSFTSINKIALILELVDIMKNEEEIAKLEAQKKQQATKKKASSKPSDPVALLREYKGLLDDGIITQEEFDAKKKEVLSSH